ncbi:lamin tail domain-containing protein [Candidatus Kaiserbacteria bacterium]|nr:lamin tail domain-containing protein [Candidatus Kaiserbacteria bacterium]
MNFKRGIIAAVLFSVFVPIFAHAFPFGGRITVHHVCYNETIFARLSAPVPGDYVWTRSTKTYQFGPPRNVGQWLLGLTSIPYDCLWSVSPIYVQPAIAIMMMGSSGEAAPTYVPPPAAEPPSSSMQVVASKSVKAPSASKAPSAALAETAKMQDPYIINQGEQAVNRVLISEVFYNVDESHGTDPAHEWVEIYNGTASSVDLSGWSIQNAGASDTIPSGVTLPSKAYILIVSSSAILTYWPGATGISIGSLIGSGLSNTGDVVRMRNSEGTIIDAVSWGSNTNGFSPAVRTVQKGYSMARSSVTRDTNSASDWVSRSVPTPGR